ncbi:MAG: DUF427 domain-containing protein [Planctomycetota bacterium]
MARATFNGVVIAESEDTIEVEGNLYFPLACLDRQYTEPSEVTTNCPWKGEASYFDIVVDGQRAEYAAWYYPSPKDAAAEIADRVAFWRGVEVSA